MRILVKTFKQYYAKKEAENFDSSLLLNPNYKNLVQFKHACLNDYSDRGEKATFHGCSCPYFKKFHLPCWHMYQLALSKDFFKELFEKGEHLTDAINSLSKGAKNTMAHALYMGYYNEPHLFSSLKNKSFKNALLKSGLIIQCEENENQFVFSKDVQENIYYVLYRFMITENMQYNYNN